MADDTILSSSFQMRSHPRWEPKNEEEWWLITKPDDVEWDFQSTEVDIQLSVVKRNIIKLIEDMQGHFSPKEIIEVARMAMKVDECRVLYRELSEKYGKFEKFRHEYLEWLPEFGKKIMSWGHTVDDATFEQQCQIAMRKEKQHLLTQIRAFDLFQHCRLMEPSSNTVLSAFNGLIVPLPSPAVFGVEQAASSEDDVVQERRVITNMYDYECCWHAGYVTLSADEMGVDKTTYARKLYERAVDDTNEFQMCAWVTVLPGYDIKDICVAIAEHHDRSNRERENVLKITSSEIKRTTDEQLMLKMMHDELENLSYMLVLDDVHYVWSTIQLDDISRLFPVKNNTVVIFTTIRDQVLSDSPYGFELFQRSLEKAHVALNDEHMLRRIIEENKEARWPQVRTLARLYVTNYRTYTQLSLALAEEGSSLASLIRWDWQYHMLPPRIRHCYLYMALFPQAFEIPMRRLIRLWIAEGLVIKSDLPSTKTLEDVAHNYLVQLEETTMIQVTKKNGRSKTCRIPEDKYKFFSSKAKDLGVFTVDSELGHDAADSSSPKKMFIARRLAEHADIKNYHSDSYIKHLWSYINFTRKKDTPALHVGDFLEKHTEKRFGLLRVLDLEGVYRPLLKEETLGKLFLLTYLGLRWTFLDSLPNSVGALQHLDTLDVKHTNITTLPSSIWKAKNLRHLYMNQVHLDLSTKKDFTDALTNLQTLWGLSIGSNSLVVKGLNYLKGLRKLGLTYHPSTAQQIADWVARLTNLQSLRLRSIDEFGEPSDLELLNTSKLDNLSDLYLVGVLEGQNSGKDAELQFPSNLKSVTLTGSQLVKSGSMQRLGKLNQLNTLRLYGKSFMGDEIIFSHNEFPKLIVLKLWRLEKLKRLEMHVGSLPNLEELDIRSCINLEDVKQLSHREGLKQVSSLGTNMPANSVKEVSSEGKEDVDVYVNKSFLGGEIIFNDNEFPKLVVLKLWMLEKLKRLEMQVGSLPSLKELDIRGCNNLEDVKGLEQLISLKMITLTNMPANFVKKVSSEVKEDVDVYVNELDFSSASSGDINNPWVMLRRVE